MAYIVNDSCIKCKHLDCVEVCPVDCFHEGENMLVINPEECIDCDVCVPECPVEAILPDTDPAAAQWIEFNRKYSIEMMWPVITENGDPDPEYENGKAGCFSCYHHSRNFGDPYRHTDAYHGRNSNIRNQF